ncbi:MAG: hypothetical protein JXX29_18105 [Deltaproteobacteria bacterium]|nr:hypothetical protein [Deltaproteobacteria bacterium]MBN2673601.1 hypothetical protein [Deltaproteobacteria bacterium]
MERLIHDGNCPELESQLTGESFSSDERGALAVCSLVSVQDKEHRLNAAGYLASEDTAAATRHTVSFLHMASRYPLLTHEFQLAVIEVAFGVGGYGDMASAAQSMAPGTPAATELVVAVLQFTHASYLESTAPNTADVANIWAGCEFLLAGSYSCDDDVLAWALHTSLAAVALRVFDPLNKTDLAMQLMKATIAVVEQNQTISVAARCDLGAPYEQLKSALSKDTSLLGPFERAVSAATGCTRGKYAPQK